MDVAARGRVRRVRTHLLRKDRPVGVVCGDRLVVGGVLQHKSEPESIRKRAKVETLIDRFLWFLREK